MTNRIALLSILALAAACSPKPQPEQPVPQPAVTTPTANADSARLAQEAADRARRHADSLAAASRDSAARANAASAAAAARAEAERAFANMIHFDYDKSDIRDDDTATLDWKARLLAANPAMVIKISGHADDRGSDEYNLALG